MQKKVAIITAVLICVLAIVLLLIPREKPESFVYNYWQSVTNNDSGWEITKVVNVTHPTGYVVVHVNYRQKNSYEPPQQWVIKDRSHLNGIDWDGYIYLVKRGLYSWSIVQ